MGKRIASADDGRDLVNLQVEGSLVGAEVGHLLRAGVAGRWRHRADRALDGGIGAVAVDVNLVRLAQLAEVGIHVVAPFASRPRASDPGQ